MESHLKKLRTDAWRTAGARFNAARRLRSRETFSSASLAMLSAAIIVVSLIQVIYVSDRCQNISSALTAVTASFGIFALVISLVEAGAKSGERALRLFQNAENLNDFQRRLEVASSENYLSFLAEYKALKDSLGGNHDPIDDDYFISKNSSAPEFEGQRKRLGFLTIVLYRLHSIWHLLAIWIFFLLCLTAVAFLLDWN